MLSRFISCHNFMPQGCSWGLATTYFWIFSSSSGVYGVFFNLFIRHGRIDGGPEDKGTGAEGTERKGGTWAGRCRLINDLGWEWIIWIQGWEKEDLKPLQPPDYSLLLHNLHERKKFLIINLIQIGKCRLLSTKVKEGNPWTCSVAPKALAGFPIQMYYSLKFIFCMV